MKDIIQDFIENCEFDHNCSPELRKVIFSNGSLHLRYQCMTCGKIHGNCVSKRNRDLSLIPNVDKEKLDNYSSRNGNLIDAKARSLDLFVKAQKEWKLNRINYFEKTFNVKYENFEKAHTLYLNSPQWKSKREKILERDQYKCRLCNKTGEIQVHHMTYGNLGNESDLELLSVCKECHSIIHMHLNESNNI